MHIPFFLPPFPLPPRFSLLPTSPSCPSSISLLLPIPSPLPPPPLSSQIYHHPHQSLLLSLPSPNLSPSAELQILFRMSVAITSGAIIGTERRISSSTAGIRTLSLVSLGAAIFSLTSLHGLGGDPTRMAAAISTGIGFLGSGAIHADNNDDGDGRGSRRHLVTAASIWIAAALGVAAACGLHGMAVGGAVGTVWVLRWRVLVGGVRRWGRGLFGRGKRKRG